MTTTTLPLTIACPDWCTDTPQDHLDELWEWECNCLHWAPISVVEDTAGLVVNPLEPRLHCKPARLRFSVTTAPDGRETQSPVFMLNDNEMSLEQAEQLAAAIVEQVELYRAWQKQQQR